MERSIITQQSELTVADARPTRPIYVVLGMHRSGTSLCSSMLNMLGVDMAEEEGAGVGNEAGHWERWPLVALQDDVLAMFNRTYYSSTHDFPLPLGWWTRPQIRPVIRRIKEYLVGIAGETSIFGFKDPRTTKLLPMWQRIFREIGFEPYYIICLRNPSHVAASLYRRDKLPIDVGEMRALDYLIAAISHTEGHRRHFIRYEEWFNDFQSNFSALVDFLHLEEADTGREIVQAAKALVKSHMNHGSPADSQPRQPLVKHFYSIVEHIADSIKGADQKAKSFIDSYTAFQQLIAPFEILQTEQLDINAQLRLVLAERDNEISQGEQRLLAAQQALARSEYKIASAEQIIQTMEVEHNRLVQDCEGIRTRAEEERQAAAAHVGDLEHSLQAEREQTAQCLRHQDTLEQRLAILHDSLADHHSAYKLLEQRLLG